MYTESFACGTKSLMRGLMFESIHILQTWAMIRGDDTKFAFRSHEKFGYKRLFIWSRLPGIQ